MGNRLYVGNLPLQADAAWLRSTFSASGEVVDVKLVSNRETGESRGFGFVTMGSSSAASKAIAHMNGATVNGQKLNVKEAEDRPMHREDSARGPGQVAGAGRRKSR